MSTHQLSNSQFTWISEQATNGVPIAQLCREYGVSVSTFQQMKNGVRANSFSAAVKNLIRF